MLFVQVSQEEWDAVVSAQTEVNPFLKWSFLNALEVSGSAVSTCAACEVCHSSCIAVEQLTGSMSYSRRLPQALADSVAAEGVWHLVWCLRVFKRHNYFLTVLLSNPANTWQAAAATTHICTLRNQAVECHNRLQPRAAFCPHEGGLKWCRTCAALAVPGSIDHMRSCAVQD